MALQGGEIPRGPEKGSTAPGEFANTFGSENKRTNKSCCELSNGTCSQRGENSILDIASLTKIIEFMFLNACLKVTQKSPKLLGHRGELRAARATDHRPFLPSVH